MSSSRFVSSGAIDASTGNRVPLEQKHDKEEEIAVNDAQSQDSTKRQQLVISGVDSSKQTPQQRTNQERWETVQKEIEEERKKKEETRLREAEGAQQSLYEVLQANKGLSISFLSSPPIHTLSPSIRCDGRARYFVCPDN